MQEINGNIWDFHTKGNWIVITTNGTLNKKDECVMGKGIALQAKKKFKNMPKELGELISHYGNELFIFGEYRLITLPTKHNWWEKSDLQLIECGIKELSTIREDTIGQVSGDIFLVRPGCSNGGLNWEEVKPILDKYLDNSFIVVNNNE